MHESHRRCQVLSAKLLGLTKVAVAAAVCGAWLTPAAHGQCPTSFAPVVNYGSGLSPFSLAIGDFNGDQRPDIVASATTSGITVHLGNANGTFQAAVAYSAGNAFALAIGDFNGDTRPDVAVVNSAAATVSVLFGNANGSFQAPVLYNVDNTPVHLAVGDFNGDGRADIVSANSSGSVSVLLNNGNGTFATAVTYLVDLSTQYVAIGDFDGNGKLDLVTANGSSNDLSLLLGIGDGTFGPAVTIAAGSFPRSLAVADFNRDGRADVAVANTNSNNVSVLLGTGIGTFAPAVNYPVGTGPYTVAIGDLNGDGLPDVVSGNFISNNLSVLVGNGTGTFAAATNFPGGSDPRRLAMGDFNGDGRLDIAASNVTGNVISVFLNTYTAFAPPAFTQHPVSQVAQAGAFATFSAAANFFGAPTPFYQWRRNGVPLANGGNISGATTSTLIINPVTAADIAAYDVQARGGCNLQATVASNPAVLTVNPIANDLCANSRPITNGSIAFSTIGANTDGPTEANLGFGSGDLQVNHDVWFMYTATAIGTATVDLCGSNFDTKVAIYNATCPAGPNTAIAGNDDFGCGSGLQSQTTFACIAGNRYLIRVGGFQNNVGTVQMNVSCLGVPACYANCDGSSASPLLTANDFQCFLIKYAQGCP